MLVAGGMVPGKNIINCTCRAGGRGRSACSYPAVGCRMRGVAGAGMMALLQPVSAARASSSSSAVHACEWNVRTGRVCVRRWCLCAAGWGVQVRGSSCALWLFVLLCANKAEVCLGRSLVRAATTAHAAATRCVSAIACMFAGDELRHAQAAGLLTVWACAGWCDQAPSR